MVTLSPNQGEVKMDIPSEVINAVKETKADLVLQPKPEKKWVKESTKRVLHAIGNGLRTASSISHALNEPKAKIVSRLWHLKDSGLVHGVKKQGSNEFKYYLTTDKPTLDKLNLDKPKRKYTKRKAKATPLVTPVTTAIKESVERIAELQADNARYIQRISQLELILSDKEKEVWTLECEVFDKKAIVKYLEEKLFALGVK